MLCRSPNPPKSWLDAWTLLLLLGWSVSAPALADLSGRAIGVHDGDTITVLGPDRQHHRVGLAGIDAPERGQPFGFRSKENLGKLVYDRDVIVKGVGKDARGRLVGKVFADGQDVGLMQVRAGLAWWDRAYAGAQTPDERAIYERTEDAARTHKLRLWRDPEPIPPWEWRSNKRKANKPNQSPASRMR